MTAPITGTTDPFPVAIVLVGPAADRLLVELDDGGRVELTPTDARALASDLVNMADEAEA